MFFMSSFRGHEISITVSQTPQRRAIMFDSFQPCEAARRAAMFSNTAFDPDYAPPAFLKQNSALSSAFLIGQ